jgi:glycosyltransferase involved in cell wall biosynthesis
VIVTDLPGQADIVTEHRCGYVIAAGDPEALAEAVSRMVADPERVPMGERGSAAAAEHHSWQAAAEMTETVILGLID